jgi:hypothetical protein
MKPHLARTANWIACAALILGGLGIGQFALQPAKADPGGNRSFTIDVAEDCNTAHINPVDPNENTLTDVSPGDTIIVGGTIYPGGTLKPGIQNNLPTDPGSIGQWLSRGVFLVNTKQLFVDGASPIAHATMLYLFRNSSSSLVSEGLVPNVGSSEMRAVIGGTGPFSGAAGEVRHENIGTNGTYCFNYRFTFKLKD